MKQYDNLTVKKRIGKVCVLCHGERRLQSCFLGSERMGFYVFLFLAQKDEGRGKVHPIAGDKAQKGSRGISPTLSLTSALDGGGWSTPRLGRFTPGKDPVPVV
jgi:hypothetical protein